MQLEKACAISKEHTNCNKDPAQPKIIVKILFFIKKESFLNVISKYWSPMWGSRVDFSSKTFHWFN